MGCFLTSPNLVVIGSIANLIVIEEARHYGVNLSFKAYAKLGVPVPAASFLIVYGWLNLLRG